MKHLFLSTEDALQNSSVEFVSIGDSPLGPIGVRALGSAVDGTRDLDRVNSVLEKVDVQDISSSSRLVMETAMESIRSSLLGKSLKPTYAMEGFKDKRSLQIAIEENKGVISTVWDAIINFFKGIYDWIAGFFGKKESTANANIEKAANVDKAATLINKIDASKPEEAREIIKEVKQLVKLKDVEVRLSDGNLVGAIATEDEKDNIRVEKIKEGHESINLITDRYSALLGSSDVKITDFHNLFKDTNKLSANLGVLMSVSSIRSLSTVLMSSLYLGNIKYESVEDFVKKEHGETFFVIGSKKINVVGNDIEVVDVEKTNITINITANSMNGQITALLNKNKGANSNRNKTFTDEIQKLIKGISQVGEKRVPKPGEDDYDKKSEDEEWEESAKLLKEKLPYINGCIKLFTTIIEFISRAETLSLDLIEVYLAGVAKACEFIMREKI